MIVLESTANGRGNLFHNEWQAAVKGTSDISGLGDRYKDRYDHQNLSSINNHNPDGKGGHEGTVSKSENLYSSGVRFFFFTSFSLYITKEESFIPGRVI